MSSIHNHASFKCHIKHFVVALLIPLFILQSNAQITDISFSQLEVHGSPFGKEANCLFEDSQGLLWIGTDSGLYRYDGNNLKTYQNDVFNKSSIANNTIRSIVEDKNDNLWIVTESFLVFYNRKKDAFANFHKNQDTEFIYSGNDEKIYVYQQKKGLVEITPNEEVDQINFEQVIKTNGGDSSNEKFRCSAIYEDEFLRMWVGTPKGLYLYKKGSELISTNIHFKINHILKGKDQTVWITSGHTLYKVQYAKSSTNFEILSKYILIHDNNHEDLDITSIVENQNRDIWIGTNKSLIKGELIYGEYVFHPIEKNNSNQDNLLSNRISSLAIDRYDNLWVGTVKGVNKYINKASIFQFKALKALNDKINNNSIKSIYKAPNNMLWIGTDENGLYRYNPLSSELLKINIKANNIEAIKEHTNPKKLLVGANRSVYEISSLNSAAPKAKLLREYEKNVMDILPISTQEIWVGLWGDGVSIIDSRKELPEYKKALADSIKSSFVSALLLDHYGNIWIGTRGKGLFMVDQENEDSEVYSPSLERGITSNAFLSIWEDNDFNIWFGTRGGGLIFYNQKEDKFYPYSKEDGLPSNTVTAVLEDFNQNIWLSTQEGLALYSEADNTFSSFGAECGILNNHFNFKSATASEDRQELYFGTVGGYYKILAEKYKKNTLAPEVILTSFQTYSQPLDSPVDRLENFFIEDDIQKITLPYKENNFSIGFSSNDLTAPIKNKYSYMLKGVNDYWINIDNNSRNVVYFDLSPDTYRFKIKSSNSDGVWADKPSELEITILPPFWQSDMAYAIYTLLGILIIIGLISLYKYWYGLKQNLLRETISREKDKQHHDMRMVFFTDISHELRTPLTLILSSIENLITKNKETISKKTAHRLHNNAMKMKQLINQIMDIRRHVEKQFSLRVQECNAVKTIKSIKTSFADHAEIQNVKLNFSSENEEIVAWLDPFIVEKIVSNLLANSLKFTQEGGQIDISISSERKHDMEIEGKFNLPHGRYVKIKIRDNGIGMTSEEQEHIFDRYYQAKTPKSLQMSGSGIGMELVYKLTKLHHGSIEVESVKNEFTEFTILLPIEIRLYQEMEIAPQINQIDEVLIPMVTNDNKHEETNTKRSKLLIVDDNEELREMIEEILKADYHILKAENGKVGYEITEKDNPDLIISDILMPEVDGINLLKKVKNSSAMNHIPFFMLTAKTNDKTKEECIKLGAQDFIEKPFSSNFLKWKIDNTLSYQKSLRKAYSKTITAEPTNIDLESPDEKLIKELITIVEENLHDSKLSVEYLATEVGMSRANLYRKLQRISNETPVNFIKQIRLKRAKQILETDKFYISEVAYMCGFNSLKYFRRCFQKEFSMSPSEYAKNHLNNIVASN